MSDFFQITASGLSLGANYALIALGFVVIYRASQVFNFAHGEFVGIGAYLMTTFVAVGLPWPLALVASMVGTGAVAALVERAVVRPMIGRPVFVTIILTIFVGYLLRTAIIVAWGIDLRNMPVPWDVLDGIKFGEVAILYNELAAIAVGLIALGGFFVVLKYTRLGVAMRAASGDQEVALALGIPVGRVFRATWFIAGMLAALAGIFLVMFPKYLDPNIGFVALAAFPAAVVGGLNSPVGTVLAGFLLGVTQLWSQAYLSPLLGSFGDNIHEVFPYVIMIIFLMVRPYGLFGKKDVERV